MKTLSDERAIITIGKTRRRRRWKDIGGREGSRGREEYRWKDKNWGRKWKMKPRRRSDHFYLVAFTAVPTQRTRTSVKRSLDACEPSHRLEKVQYRPYESLA